MGIVVKLTFSNVQPAGPGIWIASLPPYDAARFGNNAPIIGERSVIGVEAPHFESKTHSLSVGLDNLQTLCVGQDERVVFIDLGTESSSQTSLQDDEELPESSADEEFLEACRSHLPEKMTKIIIRVLNAVRERYEFKLIEGNGRKWTSAPSNFLAITIQNQKKQFLISVKADPSVHSFARINLKQSRRPYCEFHLNSVSQIEETVMVILASAKY